MRKFIRRQLTYFLIGFIVAFVIYLFVRFNADAVFLGVVIGAAAGLATCIAIYLLERRFPDNEPVQPNKNA